MLKCWAEPGDEANVGYCMTYTQQYLNFKLKLFFLCIFVEPDSGVEISCFLHFFTLELFQFTKVLLSVIISNFSHVLWNEWWSSDSSSLCMHIPHLLILLIVPNCSVCSNIYNLFSGWLDNLTIHLKLAHTGQCSILVFLLQHNVPQELVITLQTRLKSVYRPLSLQSKWDIKELINHFVNRPIRRWWVRYHVFSSVSNVSCPHV